MSRLRWYLGVLGLAVTPAAAAVGACGGSSPPECAPAMALVGGTCVSVSPDAGPDGGPVEAGSDAGPDVAAPDPDLVFGGVTSVSPASQTPTAGKTVSLFITWNAAEDPFTLPQEMGYSIYLATVSKGESYDAPASLSIQGVTSVTIPGLQEGTTYYVVVRATNKAGDQDQNTHELSAKASVDTTAPTAPGTPTVVPRLACESRLTWAAATDTGTGAAGMRYSVYLADTMPVDMSSPAAMTLGATTVDVPAPGATSPYHHFVVVAEDAAGNTSSPSGVGAPDTTMIGFESSVQPILTNDCAPSCHTVNTTNKLTPVYDDGYAYLDIMGAPGMPVLAHVCKPGTAFCGPDPTIAGCLAWLEDVDAGLPISAQLIFPGQPQCSVLYQVALQQKMPPKATGLPDLASCDTTLIHDWVEDGALP
jgi:hypothetical protein